MTEAEVLAIHTGSFYRALKSRDFGTLEQLYSESYMLVRADGSGLNKQQVLHDLRDRGLTFPLIELRGEQVRLYGAVAILTGESRTVSSRDGQEHSEHFRFVAVYAQEGATLRLVHFQSTTLAD